MSNAFCKQLISIGLSVAGTLSVAIGYVFAARAILFLLNPEVPDNSVSISGNVVLDAVFAMLIFLIPGILLTVIMPKLTNAAAGTDSNVLKDRVEDIPVQKRTLPAPPRGPDASRDSH